MKHLLIIILFLTSLVGYNQARIGYTQKEILTELVDFKITSTVGTTNEGTSYMHYDNGSQEVIHYFRNDSCYRSVIIPNSVDNAIEIKKWLDLNYTVTSNNSWSNIQENGILYISLEVIEGSYAFLFE